MITALAAACTSIAPPDTDEAPSSSAVARTAIDRSPACALPPKLLRRIWRGARSDASGDIQIVTAEPDYVGGGLSHAGPWDYVQRVPLFFYGPGRVPPLAPPLGADTDAILAPLRGDDASPPPAATVPAGDVDRAG